MQPQAAVAEANLDLARLFTTKFKFIIAQLTGMLFQKL